MGTDVLVLAPAGRAVRAARLVEELFEEWEAALSRFRPESELSRLNASAGLEVRVGPIVLAAVEAALDAARATAGLFDPTLLPDLVRVGYDRSFDEMGEPDSPAARPRGGGDWREIHVDRGRRTVRLPAGCGLDLGGVAKGMAVDAAIELLTATGLESALVDAGGDLRVHGLPPGGAAWHVGVAGVQHAPVLPLVRGALATSGTARRHWPQAGTPRHHLIDPRTGEPAASGLRQVTVAAGSCRAAEVAATAALVAGPLLGRGLLEHHGLAGLLVTDDGRCLAAGRWPGGETVPAA